jgi:hypothetical protein
MSQNVMQRMSQHFKKKGDEKSSHDRSQDISFNGDIKDYKHVSLISSNVGGYQYQKTNDPENVYMLMDYDNVSQ